MQLEYLARTMIPYLKQETIVDFLVLSRALGDVRYAMMKRKAIDEVSALILAAAKNRELFQDVSKWGIENNVASIATFSRRKDFFKSLGIIIEETVKTPFGRPKIRMGLSEEKFLEHFQI